jgi:probable HAF family extracellular repeat protein
MRARRRHAVVVPVVVAVLAMTAGGARADVGEAHASGVRLVPDAAFVPWQINERGQVLGQVFSAGGYGWSRYERGRLTPVVPPATRGTISGATMNARGDVAGVVFGDVDGSRPFVPFLRSVGRDRDLSALGDADVVALSDRGQLLVRPMPREYPADPADSALRPVVWDNGRIIVSPAPPAGSVFEVGSVNDVGERYMNATGLVVGWLRQLDPGTAEAAVWRPGGAIVALGGLGANGSWPVAVTDTGAVVGTSDDASGRTRVFVWHAGRGMVDIGVPAPGAGSLAVEAVGDNGQAVVLNDQNRRYLWNGTSFTDVDGYYDAEVRGVNDRGQIILTSYVGSPPTRQGFVWQAGQLVRLDSSAPPEDRRDTVPFDITNRGYVVGTTGESNGAMLWHVAPTAR